MPSPFPGVDPYLESQGLWPDFHLEFISCWRSVLLDVLPGEYDARLDERVYLVEMPEGPARLILPDVGIEHLERSGGSGSVATQDVSTLEPVTLPLCVVGEEREVFIKILHREDRSLVAVLECLSPTNKTTASQGVYLERRAEIIRSPIHLVELDLLLGGHRLPMGKPLPPGHYYAFVSRGDRRPQSDVYAWTIRDRLPKIPIPLREPESHVVVDLAQVFEIAYERGRYGRVIDAAAPLEVPLDDGDRQWALSRLEKKAGERPQ